METEDHGLAQALLRTVTQEARRIEAKFSRYRKDNIVYQINHESHKQAICVDAETARLLNYAQECYELSEGLFDISAGTLSNVWHFDSSDRVPTREQIRQCLQYVGWEKVHWDNPLIRLPPGTQIDLGGIGKEYAVDHCVQQLRQSTSISCLVNFGGDIAITTGRHKRNAWCVGVENPSTPGQAGNTALKQIRLTQGAVATSGDVRRYVLKNGVRYGHILNPKTGWPETQAPRSITVAAPTCSQAGVLSTLAMLQGEQAESFLSAQQVQYWCLR